MAEDMVNNGSHNFTKSHCDNSIGTQDNSEKYESLQISAAGEKNPVFFQDIGSFTESQHQITDDLKNLIEKPRTPDLSFHFPCSGARNLKFQAPEWLSIWKWLVYSASKDGAFCKFCALFHCSGVGQQSLPAGKLVSVPYSNWKNDKEDFKRYEEMQYHAKCKERAINFLATFTGEQQSIDVVLNKTLQDEITSNRQKSNQSLKL